MLPPRALVAPREQIRPSVARIQVRARGPRWSGGGESFPASPPPPRFAGPPPCRPARHIHRPDLRDNPGHPDFPLQLSPSALAHMVLRPHCTSMAAALHVEGHCTTHPHAGRSGELVVASALLLRCLQGHMTNRSAGIHGALVVRLVAHPVHHHLPHGRRTRTAAAPDEQ
ncbi:hypothetical protein VPH35_072095 [Triticum aestivum]